ncbi:MAG: hypothetical protein AAF449_06635 [Myxococcota bacterium]
MRKEGPGWRSVDVGDVLVRPASFKTVGFNGYVRFSVRGARLIAQQDAVVHIGAPGPGLVFQIDRGLILAHRNKQQMRALLPAYEADVVGQTFGAWVGAKVAHVSVLAKDLEIIHRKSPPQKFSFGREIALREGRLDPSIMPSKLVLEKVNARRSGRRTRIAGRTSFNARVFAFKGDGFERVDLTTGGTFVVRFRSENPEPGALFAMDSAGRWAELDSPSRRLEQVIEDLRTGQPRGPRPDLAMSARPLQETADKQTRRPRRRSSDRETQAPKKKKRAEPLAPPPAPASEDEELDETAL